MKIEARVTRKTRDLVLDSAEELLRRKVPQVAGLARAEIWTFDVDDAAAESDVRHVLEDTTLVVNPNIHRWALDGGEAPAGPRVTVRVTERVDAKGAAVLRGIRERYGARGVSGVTRAVEWWLDLEPGAAGDADRIAGEAGRILGNPHAQEIVTRVTAGSGTER